MGGRGVWWPGLGLAVVALGGFGACREEPEPTPYVPPTYPPPPPREVRLDKATGAILTKPANEWQWIEGEALRALDPNAVLGVREGPRCEGWVAVAAKVEASPRGAAQRVLEARRAEATWDTHVDEDVLYASHTARRWEIQRPDGNTVVSERASFLVEGPRLYALHARARDREYTRRRRCLDAVTAAFDVMMWEPSPDGAEVDAGPTAEAPDGGGLVPQDGGPVPDAAGPVPGDGGPVPDGVGSVPEDAGAGAGSDP